MASCSKFESMDQQPKNLNSAKSFEEKILQARFIDESQPELATTGQWMQRTYRQLHKIALSQMRNEKCDNTLSATSLIHEVFLRLRTRDPADWINERQFLGIVAAEMKRVLIDAARRKKTVKRGGERAKCVLEEQHLPSGVADSIVELNEAIDEFEKIEPRKAELVRLRYFLGLSEVEAAKAMGISRATASRHWTFARAWLLDFLTE